MKLSLKEKEELEKLYQEFLNNELILKMKSIPMHRGSNCYLHSFRVTKLAIKNAIKHKHPNLKNILIASILHDYYLYDWRVERDKKKGHTSKHPQIAIENARRDFDIEQEVASIIGSHMWPFNFRTYPKTKEARIVGLADTLIATKEAFTSIAYKRKRLDRYYKQIERLFDE